MTTSSSKITPRVEALNRLLTWVEKAEENYNDRTGFDSCEIEERVSCFITYVVGNLLTKDLTDPSKLRVALLYIGTVEAVRDLFEELDIHDDELGTELINTSLLSAAGVILGLPCDDTDEAEAARQVVVSQLDALQSIRLCDLIPST